MKRFSGFSPITPRYRLDIFLVAPQLPLAESPVRDALIWFIQHRENSVARRIERAVARAESPDAAEEIAADLARKHYLDVFRSQRKDHTGNIVTRGFPLTRKREFTGELLIQYRNIPP